MPAQDKDLPDEEWLKPPPSTLGLHQVYPDPKARSNPTIDVVFVHGLGGDAYSTWTRDDTLWIRDLLPTCSYFEDARIMTFGYDARAFLHPFARSSTGRTFTFAEALLNDLDDKRTTAAAKKRPIIFMGHSLGGIVIKSALRHAHALYSQYGNILDSTKAIVFFGTPHQGADTATWAAFLGGLSKAIRIRNTEVVEELKRWSNPLVELTTTFAELAPRFQITTFFEELATNGILVVPQGSARIGNERARGLQADHRGVCKFTELDPNWTPVKGRLEAIAVGIQEELAIQLPTAPTLPAIGSVDLGAGFEEQMAQRMERLRSGK